MYEVFISFKNLGGDGKQTPDSAFAANIYNALSARGIQTFFSSAEIRRKANPRYGKMIDDALEEAKVLIVVGTRLDYVKSEWIEYEWRYFSHQILAKKDKQIITAMSGFDLSGLPPAFSGVENYDPRNIAAITDMVLGILNKRPAAAPPAPAAKPAPAQTEVPASQDGPRVVYVRADSAVRSMPVYKGPVHEPVQAPARNDGGNKQEGAQTAPRQESASVPTPANNTPGRNAGRNYDNKKIAMLSIGMVLALVVFPILSLLIITCADSQISEPAPVEETDPAVLYAKAVKLYESRQYYTASGIFERLSEEGYRDSDEYYALSRFYSTKSKYNSNDIAGLTDLFSRLSRYSSANEECRECCADSIFTIVKLYNAKYSKGSMSFMLRDSEEYEGRLHINTYHVWDASWDNDFTYWDFDDKNGEYGTFTITFDGDDVKDKSYEDWIIITGFDDPYSLSPQTVTVKNPRTGKEYTLKREE